MDPITVDKVFFTAQGCFENLYLLQGIMRDAKTSGRYLAVTFIDLAKSFNTISHNYVVKGLERFGVDCKMIGLVKELYTGVSTTFEVGDLHTVPIPILRGVKHGDPMSPILFNICMDPLLSKLDELKAGYEIDGQRCGDMSFTDDLVYALTATEVTVMPWRSSKSSQKLLA